MTSREPHRHRYPTECPECHKALTDQGAVLVFFSIAGTEVVKPSQLDDDGVLEDVDNLVANGYHSDTYCGGCNQSLAEHEHAS